LTGEVVLTGFHATVIVIEVGPVGPGGTAREGEAVVPEQAVGDVVLHGFVLAQGERAGGLAAQVVVGKGRLVRERFSFT